MNWTMFRTISSIRRVFDPDTSLYPLVLNLSYSVLVLVIIWMQNIEKKIEVFKHVIHNSYRDVFLLVYMYFTF